MARAKVDLEFPKAAILWRLHKAIADYEKTTWQPHLLANKLGFSNHVINLCLEDIENEGHCRITVEEEWDEHPLTGQVVKHDETYIQLTKSGINEVESWSDNSHSDLLRRLIDQGAHLDPEEIIAAHAGAAKPDHGTEAKEDEWEPLPIDREAPEYAKAVETVEEALKKIEQDNGYADSAPEERDTVVWSLRTGLIAIMEKAPSLSQVKAMILEPLNKAIQKFREAVPGVAAMMAKEAIKEWIKSLFR